MDKLEYYIDPLSLWSYDDPKMTSILAFYKIVEGTWGTTITSTTPIPRTAKKAFRNVLRDYIKHAPVCDNSNYDDYRDIDNFPNTLDPHAPFCLVLPTNIVRNVYYVNFMYFKNGFFERHYNNLNTFRDIETLGQLLLFFVVAIMRVEIEQTNENNIVTKFVPLYEFNEVLSTKKDYSSKMTYACSSMLWQLCSIGYYKENPNIVLGLPMYYWYGVNVKTVYDEITKPFTGNGNKLPNTWSKGPLYFTKYILDNHILNHYQTNCITINYNGYKATFVSSVPEFVLDGLCYTVNDKITKYGNDHVQIYMMPNGCKDGHTYTYLCSNDQGTIVSLPCTGKLFDEYHDQGAIRYQDNDINAKCNGYCFKSLLIMPEDTKVYQFEDSHVKYNNFQNDYYAGPPVFLTKNGVNRTASRGCNWCGNINTRYNSNAIVSPYHICGPQVPPCHTVPPTCPVPPHCPPVNPNCPVVPVPPVPPYYPPHLPYPPYPPHNDRSDCHDGQCTGLIPPPPHCRCILDSENNCIYYCDYHNNIYPYTINPVDYRLNILKEKIAGYIPLIKHLKDTCKKENDAAKKLEHHIETMRQYMVMASNKVDYHTCRKPTVSVPKHSIDKTYPSIKDSDAWKINRLCYIQPHSMCFRTPPAWMIAH
ncbi:p4c precursor [Pteropox virus]|uniref:p4c n=1 Tax=Pteropox virus TaxID=1873698 RepID=A0A1B1MRN8_9POXV|nr:p4c precursor [Pteropox virus]ANS71205.1 p4c precursor [Pteropox virus]